MTGTSAALAYFSSVQILVEKTNVVMKDFSDQKTHKSPREQRGTSMHLVWNAFGQLPWMWYVGITKIYIFFMLGSVLYNTSACLFLHVV
jgi:hypothetical protein